MLKSLVNVQMNSAVQWLMFRGIQHLLEIEINSRCRCVEQILCSGGKVRFTM